MKYFKIVTPVFVLLMMSCAAQNINKSFDDIMYEARTRGSHIKISVINKKISYSTQETTGSYELSTEELNGLNESIEALKLEDIVNLNASTDNSATDRALIAKITIKLKDKEYSTSNFDAGNPPKELKKLENLLYQLAK